MERRIMNPTYDFENQVALVTGAASGMGLATARAFAQAGADRRADRLTDELHCGAPTHG
jgi:NAD(P)-dependent dehydrogenase (short-subunit alcohol dehydrogenase family)